VTESSANLDSPFIADADEAVARRPDIWESLRGARVFVSGGTGFLGSWLIALCARANRRYNLDISVTAAARDERRLARAMDLFAADLTLDVLPIDLGSITTIAGTYSHVLHAAATVHASSGEASADEYARMIAGVENMLRLARRTGARFLLLSSGAIYGHVSSRNAGCVDEDTPRSALEGPWKAYAEAKRISEDVCQQEPQVHTTIARIFSCAGYGMALGQYAIGNFIADALEDRPIRVRNERVVRTYLHAADTAEWLWAMCATGHAHAIYNVGGNEPITMRGLAMLVAESASRVNHAKAGIVFDDIGGASGIADRYVPCVDRARKDLGLTVATPLSQTVDRCVTAVARFTYGRICP